jgi:hypothetical protein
MASASSEVRMTGQARHRRDTWLYIFLPLFFGGVLVFVLLVLVLLLPKRAQVSLVADLMLTVCVLCPTVICLFPIYLLLIVAAFGMSKLHHTGAKQLVRLETMSRELVDKTQETTDRMNRISVSLNGAAAPLNRLGNIFDRPAPKVNDEENHEHDSPHGSE